MIKSQYKGFVRLWSVRHPTNPVPQHHTPRTEGIFVLDDLIVSDLGITRQKYDPETEPSLTRFLLHSIRLILEKQNYHNIVAGK